MPVADSLNKRKDFLPWLFFFLAVATRVPFTSKLLLNMDACQFALALDRFDITVHQPHPPGYILYVMLGRLVHLLIADPNAVFVSISVFFSGLTVASVYLLGKEMFERKIGIVAALLAVSSPSLWFYGEVSLTYVLEAFFSTLIALFCWRVLSGEEKYLWILAVVLGLAGGIRQNTPVFLLPVWFYSVRRVPSRKIVASLVVTAATSLLWFLPMVWLSGGLDAYRAAFRELWLFNTGGHGILEGEWGFLRLFSLKMLLYLIFGLGAGLFPLALAAYSIARRRRSRLLDATKVFFLSFWVLPVMMFYLFIFLSIQNPGYILVFLPALLVLASLAVFHIAGEFGERARTKACVSIISVVMAVNTAAFFWLPVPVSHRWIREHDRNLTGLLADLRRFDSRQTVVVVNNLIYYSYRHIMVYLPAYRSYNVDVRTAPTGERRKTFWGVNGETFLEKTVVFPATVIRFVTPVDREDEKYGEREMYENAGIDVRDLNPNMFVASGSIGQLSRVYPGLQVSSGRRRNFP